MKARTSAALVLGAVLWMVGGALAQQKPDEIPDAPSASRPIPPSSSPNSGPGNEENAAPQNSPGGRGERQLREFVSSASFLCPNCQTEVIVKKQNFKNF